MEESLGMTKTQAKSLMKYISDNMKVPVLGAGGGFAPFGCINAYMGTVAPQGWLICNGQTVNITDYPELAAHFASQLGSSNVFGGDGTTTFAMPDLRGEFLRGSGTNSHANQGSGGAVGEHQDGTQSVNPFIGLNKGSGADLLIFGAKNPMSSDTNYDYYATTNKDKEIGRLKNVNVSIRSVDDVTSAVFGEYTSRPTNTSVLHCVKY
jgi:hypothetical protein